MDWPKCEGALPVLAVQLTEAEELLATDFCSLSHSGYTVVSLSNESE